MPEHVVAEIAAPKGSPDDLADVHDTDELVRIAQADEVALVGRPPQAPQVDSIRAGGRGRLNPATVKPSTLMHRRHELGRAYAVDPERNGASAGDREIGAPDAAVRTLLIVAREDLEIAREVRDVLAR